MLPLIVCLIMGVVCAIIAHSKGRSAIGWFFVGLLLGLIGLIIVLVISNVREEEARQQSIEQENRRLREQIRQEQIKAEAFRTHAQYRLDAHDQKLGIDTRADGRVLEGEAPVSGLLQSNETIAPPASPVASPVTAPEGGPPDWYYAIGAQTFGPVAAGKITQLLRDKTIPETVMVWTEGMANWSPIEQVPQLNIPVNP
jgi:hypothetical protein